jgi:uncharacterized RDD family membrane protein YckC
VDQDNKNQDTVSPSQPDLGRPSAASPVASAQSYTKADTGKRIVAYLIDALGIGFAAGIIAFVPIIGGLISFALPIAYVLLRDGLEFDFMDRRSFGKKIMKLRPVRLDGQPMDITTSIKRNWTFIIPILPIVEFILMLSDSEGRRIGDKVGETMVIEVAD